MTNAEARFNKSLRPRKPEGSLGRTAQDVHLDSHSAPELSTVNDVLFSYKGYSQHSTMIRFVNHLILVAKMCVGIFKYSTSLEIKFLFDRELNVRSIT